MGAKVLEGKAAIITGAAQGMAWATAKLFADEGAKVFILDMNPAGAEKAKELCDAGFWARFQTCDVSDSKQVKAAVDRAAEEMGKIDILVNNAGIVDTLGCAEVDEEVFDKVIAVNLKGVFLTMKYTIPYMISNGGGSVVNISSVSSVIFRSAGIGDAYAASKGGVNSLTASAAVKYAKYHIRCNCVLPGAIRTPATEEAFKEWDPRVPLRRVGEPEDIASVSLFLASDASAFITAASIPAAGGAHAAQAPRKRKNSQH